MAATSSIFCGPCEAQDITKQAEHWCPECEEGLCYDCQKHHSVSKATRNHGVISVENYKKLPKAISEVVHHCQDHNMRHQMYCSQHDQICCPVCVATNHQKCTELKAISELIKTSKTSTLLANMEQSLRDIKNNIDKVIRNRKENLSMIGIQRDKFIDDVKQMRIKINSHLDRLEQKIANELRAAEKEAKAKIEKLLRQICKTDKEVDELQHTLLAVKEYASNLQTFFGTKTMELQVDKLEKYLKSVQESESLQEFNLNFAIDEKVSTMLSPLKSFGKVSIAASAPSVVLKIEKEKQAQIMAVIQQPSPNPIHNIKVSLAFKVNHPKADCDVRGCVVLPNDKIILTDVSYNGGLLILNKDGVVDIELPVKGSYDVTSIHDTLIAVSTGIGVKFVDLDSRKTIKTMKPNNTHFGITNDNGKVLWCEQSLGIRTAMMSCNHITTLIKEKSSPEWAYIAAWGDNIYTTNPKTGTVICYQGMKKLWQFADASVLRDPAGITVDSHRNVFITSSTDNKVVVISPDGGQGKVLLKAVDGIEIPYGIDFDPVGNILNVVNKNGTILKYNISYS